MKNENLNYIRKFFVNISNLYKLRLHDKFSNEEISEKYNQLYPDTKFHLANFLFYRTY